MKRCLATAALVLCVFGCGGSLSPPRIAPATDDASLVARVRTALLNDPIVHGTEINVRSEGGIVVLSGQVHGEQEANAAAAIARRIEGVKDVRSEMQTNR